MFSRIRLRFHNFLLIRRITRMIGCLTYEIHPGTPLRSRDFREAHKSRLLRLNGSVFFPMVSIGLKGRKRQVKLGRRNQPDQKFLMHIKNN